MEIIKMLSKFNEIIDSSAEQLKPNHLANYLHELAAKFNTYYHENEIPPLLPTTKVVGFLWISFRILSLIRWLKPSGFRKNSKIKNKRMRIAHIHF